MNRRRPGLLIIIAVMLLIAAYFHEDIQAPIQSGLNDIKAVYTRTLDTVRETYEEHFAQRRTLIEQRERLKRFEKTHLVSHQIASELHALLDELNTSIPVDPNVGIARTLSYVNFGDINKLWLEMRDFNASRIYGLIHREHAAGIIVERNGKPMALLNGDVKSSYAVYVGEAMAPGIVHGLNTRNLLVEYIPTWIEISVGDEVVTSGLDNLFFKGIKVGKVTKIERSQGYQNALVEPYYNAESPHYFHVVYRTH